MREQKIVENPLKTLPIKRLIWKFAIPEIITQLVNSMHNIVDQVFIGWRIGDFGVAATTIVFPITSILTALSALFSLGFAARYIYLHGYVILKCNTAHYLHISYRYRKSQPWILDSRYTPGNIADSIVIAFAAVIWNRWGTLRGSHI